ncbi:hypothetical protein CEXT_319191 [Caerostris extrusa]|uniref:Uncharacterized protein n=1 Tax=Caerostris extrusa TaxID=172846 RepID=A0AAV4QIZ9_CAEEX|nr:hypothetical protein CEXT_319191 [Caerostris extrusa]
MLKKLNFAIDEIILYSAHLKGTDAELQEEEGGDKHRNSTIPTHSGVSIFQSWLLIGPDWNTPHQREKSLPVPEKEEVGGSLHFNSACHLRIRIKNCLHSEWEEYLAPITPNISLFIAKGGLFYLKIIPLEDFQQYFLLKEEKDIKPFPKRNVPRID